MSTLELIETLRLAAAAETNSALKMLLIMAANRLVEQAELLDAGHVA